VAEGVQENSRRHGYLMSMIGIRQIAVCVNKMDLAGYRQEAFEAVRAEYAEFLERIGLEPLAFIPITAREGGNVAGRSAAMPWYDGPTILELLDTLQKEPAPVDKPLRLPVQDVYKFTEQGDDRRIIAGRIVTGRLHVGDEVVFLPSGKRSRVRSLETFPPVARDTASAGESTGLTLTSQVYVKPGELLIRADEPAPRSSTKLRANLIWLSPKPMVMGQRYKLKLHAARATAYLTAVHTVIDASDLSTVTNRRQLERHDVAQVTIETLKPVACDAAADLPLTGRFVIIDDYEIAGGGVILEAEQASNTLVVEHVRQRNQAWVRSTLSPQERAGLHGQRPALVVICGPQGGGMEDLGRAVEEFLHRKGRLVYYLGLSNQLLGLNADLNVLGGREEFLRRLGETAHLFTDAGLIVITSIADLDDFELETLDVLNQPGELVVVNIGEVQLSRRRPDLVLDRVDSGSLDVLHRLLLEKRYIQDYQI
jgi:bifunctional enzyme CysN/CysC